MDILILSLSRWDGPYSSTVLSLAKVFARTHRVFYIDYPFTMREFITHIWQKSILKRIQALVVGRKIWKTPIHDLPNFIAVTPMLTLPVNWLPEGRIFSMLRSWNDKIVFNAIRKTISAHKLRRFLFLNSFNPLYGNSFPNDFKPTLSIYHCVDDISRSPYVSRHGVALEHLAIQRADITITTSHELTRMKAQYSNNVHLLANAANVALFQRAATEKLERPAEIKNLPEDAIIVTYMGNICHRIDYTLLNKVTDALPGMYFLMIGPHANNAYKKTGLADKENIIFTGAKKLDALPAYLQYSHCCIIPFLCNELTKSIYPLKINEYLSAGKPVVTTDFSEDVTAFHEVAFIAHSTAEFIDQIKNAVSTDSSELKEKRMVFSSQNSWEKRATQFWQIIDQHPHGRQLVEDESKQL